MKTYDGASSEITGTFPYLGADNVMSENIHRQVFLIALGRWLLSRVIHHSVASPNNRVRCKLRTAQTFYFAAFQKGAK